MIYGRHRSVNTVRLVALGRAKKTSRRLTPLPRDKRPGVRTTHLLTVNRAGRVTAFRNNAMGREARRAVGRLQWERRTRD